MPSAIVRPLAITWMRRQTPITTRMLCSISSTPQPNSAGNARDQPHQAVALGIREPGGRLVEQQEARRLASARPMPTTALVAIGQRVGPIERPALEAHPAQDLARPPLGGARDMPAADRRGLEVLDHRQAAEQPHALEGAGEPGARAAMRRPGA